MCSTSGQIVLIVEMLISGLDHTRAMVYEHCKKLLENLILLASTQEGQNIARMLLEYRSNISDTLKLIAEDREGPGAFGKFHTVVSFMFGHQLLWICKLHNFNGALKVNSLTLAILIQIVVIFLTLLNI